MNHTINQTEYKDSAVGRTPASWEVCQLSSILELKHGYQFRTPDFRESGIKVVKIGQVIGDGKLDLTDCDFISEELAEQKREFLLSAGDILMSLTGNIGRVGIVPDIKSPLIQNYRVGKFAPVRERVEQNFLSQLLGSNFVTYQLETSSNMTAQANFGKSDIDKIKVKLPPLAEQQKIASILTSVDEVIEKIESQISKLQDLKKGMMQELLTQGIGHTEFKDSPVGRIPVGWEVEKIGESEVDVLDGDRGNEYPKEKDFAPTGYCLFLSAKNVTKNGFVFLDCSFISKEKDEKLRKGHLDRFDMVITTRGTVGNIAFFDDSVSYDHIRINSGMAILRNNDKSVRHDFLYQLLNSFSITNQIDFFTFGSAQPQR